MKIVRPIVLAAALAFVPAAAQAQGKPAAKDALLYFVTPKNGQVIKGAFWARFGLRNMGVTHAGDDFPNSGHHHLLIDVAIRSSPTTRYPRTRITCISVAGQTEVQLDLPPGRHTLQLVLGDGRHYPFNPPLVSEKITITIK